MHVVKLPISLNKFKIHQFRYFSCKSLLEMGVSNFCVIFSMMTMASARRIAQEDEYYYKLPPPSAPPLPPAPAALRPGITVIVGAIATIFAITFMLLLYVQHCKTGSLADSRVALPLARADSGVNRKVIQQLPLFRFASLRGQKDGLECAVCLTRFEPEEVLRLLPKCKHAFHVECVDTWLDQHSTCPLCRYRVRPEDILLIDCTGSSHKALHNYRRGVGAGRVTPRVGGSGQMTPRVGGGGYSNRHSSVGEKSGGVPAPGNELKRRSSFDSWSSRRRRSGQLSRNTSRRDERLGVAGDKHRLEHKILVQDGGEAAVSELGQRRRSEVQAQEEEVLYIRTEMLMGGGDDDDDKHNDDDDEEEEESSGSSSGGRRRERNRSDVGERKGKEKEEEGIVKRLMDWIPQFQQHQKPAAKSVASTSSSAPV